MRLLHLVVLGLAAGVGCGVIATPRAKPIPADASVSPALAVVAAGPVRGSDRPDALPVTWSDGLELPRLADIDAQLNAVVPGAFGELSLDGDNVIPTSCIQWLGLHRQGYEPRTTLDAQPGSGARRRCQTLLLLKQARPPHRSAVREFRFDKHALTSLPAALAASESPEQVKSVAAATQRKQSLAAFDTRARVGKAILPGVLEIIEGGRQSTISIEPMAWGDFDGDGMDDVVVSVVNSMTHGSVLATRVLVLTRSEAREVLRVVQ